MLISFRHASTTMAKLQVKFNQHLNPQDNCLISFLFHSVLQYLFFTLVVLLGCSSAKDIPLYPYPQPYYRPSFAYSFRAYTPYCGPYSYYGCRNAVGDVEVHQTPYEYGYTVSSNDFVPLGMLSILTQSITLLRSKKRLRTVRNRFTNPLLCPLIRPTTTHTIITSK